MVEFATATFVAALPPNNTPDAPVNPVPVTVAVVPPVVGPRSGLTAVTVGGGLYVYSSATEVALVPPGVVTVTSTVPISPAGDTQVRVDALVTWTSVADAMPNETVVAPLTNPEPLIVTVCPPAAGPLLGLTDVTVGATSYVNSSAAEVVLVPPAEVTVTSCVPDPAGATAVIEVALLNVTD